jgi:hypothetical protein
MRRRRVRGALVARHFRDDDDDEGIDDEDEDGGGRLGRALALRSGLRRRRLRRLVLARVLGERAAA